MSSGPHLPTYRTVAAVLERKTGSGVKLLGWTLARTILIAPPMQLVGIPAKQAWLGAGLASGLISSLTLLRIFNGRNTVLQGGKICAPGGRGRRRYCIG